MNVAIIPARGGSRRIPQKNIRPFHGRPIIAYSIDAARESDLFDCVWVSTDDAEIARVAEGCGARVHHRDPAYARDEVGTQEVMHHVLQTIGGKDYEVACCIYATSPMICVDEMRSAYDLLRARPAAAYAFSIQAEPLAYAAHYYFGRVSSFLARRPLVTATSIMIPTPNDRVCDINTEEDWARAVTMYARLHGIPENIGLAQVANA